jgi:diguanylate cyclase (GGDEF)-like protein/PAS domain S-box-containing protein
MIDETITLLYVEDEPEIRANMERFLKRLCDQLYVAEDGEAGLERYQEVHPDIIVSDIKMPRMSGIEMVKKIKEMNPEQKVVFTTAHSDSSYFLESIEMQVDGYIAKPIDFDLLAKKIKKLSNEVILKRKVDLHEQMLLTQKEYYNSLLDHASDAIFVICPVSGDILEANQMTSQLLGYSVDELKGLNVTKWDSDITMEEYHQLIEMLMVEKNMKFERVHVRKDGSTYDAAITATLINHNGENIVYASTRDITEEKKINELIARQKNELSTIFETSVDAIVIINLALDFVRFNRSFQELLSYSEEELLGLSCINLTIPEDEERVRQAIQQLFEEGMIRDFEKTCIDKHGRHVILNSSMALMPDQEHIIISNKDITTSKKQERMIQRYVNLIDDNIITSQTDLNGVITSVSNAFCRVSGYSREELIGQKHNIIRHPDMPQEAFAKLWGVIKSENSWEGEIKNRAKDGSAYWVNTMISPTLDDEGMVIGYTAIRQDITDKKRVEELSITDGLTGIYNRRYFNEIIDQEISCAHKAESNMLFIMMDIDNFKKYNDTYGHQKGDEVLKAVAKTIKKQLKGENDYSFRLGGEEFAVLSRCDGFDDAMRVAESIRASIEGLKILHEKNDASEYVTVSLGFICRDLKEVEGEDELYLEADQLLYQAKESGRNRVVAG